jgi:Protein of unknown function (DUF2795)
MSYTDFGDARLAAGGWRRSYGRISWGAVVAGAVVAAATMLLLSFLGVAIGAGALRLSQANAADWRNYGLGAGIWTAVDLIISMLFGGYVAARLSGTHSHLDGELHGITVWGVAVLLATLLLAQLASLAVGTVTEATGTNVSTRSVAVGVGPQSLVDRLQQSLASTSDPTQMTHGQINTEIATLTGRLLANGGNLTDQDRDRLTTLVAAQSDVTRDEAARRVARMEQNATTILAQARSAADTAAAGAALGARAVFSSLLLGLGAAMLGAWFGTRHARVLTPVHEPAYETHTTTYVAPAAYAPAPVPTSLHVYEEPARPVPTYLRDVAFPATKQELLRAARAANDEPTMLRRLEQVPDRSYASLDEVMSAIMARA